MKHFLFALLLGIVVGMPLCGCSDDDPILSQLIVGEWDYKTTQEKVDGKWCDMASQAGVTGSLNFSSSGDAVVTMTYGEQSQSKSFKWELLDDGAYMIEGQHHGYIVFEGNDRFYLISDNTLDPWTGTVLRGEFRDIFDRKK